MDWMARGRNDRRDGIPRAAAPNDGENGRQWRQGWDAENERLMAEEAEEAVTENVPVYLKRNGGFYNLVDAKGRVLGGQTHIMIEQDVGGCTDVTVRFTQVTFLEE